MALCLLFCALAQALGDVNLGPTASYEWTSPVPQVGPPHSLLSDDGRALFICTPLTRVDVGTSRTVFDNYVKVVVGLRPPMVAVSRTTSQEAHYPSEAVLPTGRGDVVSSTSNGGTQFWGEALTRDRLLVCSSAVSGHGNIIAGASKIRVLTEVHFEERIANPNLNWILSVDKADLPCTVRFATNNQIEVWFKRSAEKGLILSRYVISRKAGAKPKLVKMLTLQGFATNDELVPNSIDLARQTYIRITPSRRMQLVRFAGRILKEATIPARECALGCDNEGLWAFRVPESSVPQGKATWVPISCSANGRLWLLRGVRSGKFKLLSLHNG